MSPYTTYIPLSDVVSWWPDHLFGNPDLTRVAITGYQLEQAASRATAHLDLAFGSGDDLVIPIAGLDGFEFFLPPAALSIEAEYAGTFELRASGFDAGLRIRTSLLIPVDGTYPNWIPRLDEAGQPDPLEMTLQIGELVVDADFCPTFEITNALTLPAFMLGDSGIVIEVSDATLYLSGKEIPPPGQPEGFRGVSADSVKVYLPPGFDVPGVTPESIFVRSLVIGHGGVSGSFAADWTTGWEGLTPVGDGAGTLLGLPFALKSAGVAITQNALTSAVFTGEIGIPFLDAVLGVEATLDAAGVLKIGLTQTDQDGLLTIDLPNLGTLTLSSVTFVDDTEGAGVVVNGSLLPSVLSPALQWPTIDVSGLRISADGRIQLPDGWLDLQTPVALDLYGFRLEISRIGFGNTDDGRRWVGYSAGVHLVDFLPTGVSVEGLRVTWDPAGASLPQVTLQGVGLALTLPGVLTLDGDVAFVNEETERYFEGNAKLALLPLGITLDASLKVGRNLEDDYKFVYTFMEVTLPIGLPLWATGAALYGVAGLYGMNVNPNATNGDWYGWYAGQPAPLNVTHTGKWIGTADGKAVGAGITLGTLFDLGRVVSVKGLFVLVLPGPVIMLDGKANFLQMPPENDDPSSEGVLNALALLDGRAGTLQLNVDAAWNLSQVIDIAASAEAFFDFSNPRAWHFYLGQDQPEDRRIRADVLGLLHGDAYLMIDSDGIATGAGISWGYDWRFGPVKVILRSWIGAAAAISWVPPQLEGSLNLGGEFEISVAGFGAGLRAEAILSGKAPTLYWIRGELQLTVKLPWPIDDLEEEIVLEWRQDLAPPIEPARTTISLVHPKVDETWIGLPAGEQGSPVSAGYLPGPIVPLDARPSISFDRGMQDLCGRDTFTSVDAYGGGVSIGNYTFDYELIEVALDKWPKAGGTAWTPVPDRYGTWMAVEDGDGEPAFTRLQLWAKSPFAFTRQTSRTYRDAFLANHASWPCVTPPEIVTHCVDWEGLETGKKLGPAFEHHGLFFTLLLSNAAEVVAADPETDGGTEHALRIEDGSLISLWIVFPEPVHAVELWIAGTYLAARAFGNGALVADVLNPAEGSLGLQGTGIDCIALFTSDNCEVAKICYQTEALVTEYASTYEHNRSVYDSIKRWASDDEILEPETFYRLTVRHQTARTHNGDRDSTPYTQYAYFQTAGPPALSPAWAVDPPPATTGEAALPFPHGGKLTSLAPYIASTIPRDGAVPVYGAYDLGAEFNENYVEQMVGADMVIRITDANDRPVAGANGEELLFPNQWAEQPIAELSDTEYSYTTRIEGCMALSVGVAADQRVAFANSVLLEEDFSGSLDQWTDAHPASGGTWSVAEGHLLYSNTGVAVLGALLVAGESTWTDYALEVTLSDEGEDVGLAFRYSSAEGESYYRLRLNASGRVLERVVDDVADVLWEDAVPYAATSGLVLAVYCDGDRLRGQLGGELLCDLVDAEPLAGGQVGIFTNSTAAFEQYLVRTWPGSALAPQTQYRAELQASVPLLADGLTASGWIDTSYAWVSLTRENARIAALGRDVWTDYRVEVSAQTLGRQIGVIVRFEQDVSAGTFACDRLVLNLNQQSVTLARISGTVSGTTFELDAAGAIDIWTCGGAVCDVDFTLSTHDLALTCLGDLLIVEIDGTEVFRGEGSGGPAAGKAGLFYLGSDEPVFSDLVVRTAPRGTVHQWSFVTSRYAGFVEHLDTFAGEVYRERVSDVDIAALTPAVALASAEWSAAAAALADARALLASAGPADFTILRDAALTAGVALRTTSSAHFDAVYARLFGVAYRPLPPVVEVSQIVQRGRRVALLVESPEPIDASRVTWQLRKAATIAGTYRPVAATVLLSEDGTRALIVNDAVRTPEGHYELQLTYALDIGLESPVLRRGGSTLPEIARLRFDLGTLEARMRPADGLSLAVPGAAFLRGGPRPRSGAPRPDTTSASCA